MKSISHSPNSTLNQQLLAISFFLLPWKWFSIVKGKFTKKLENNFATYLGIEDSVSFSTGREALYALIKSLGLGQDDEIIIQGYTCIVVPNAVLYNKVTPIYVDVDKSLNIDPNLIEQKISSRTKAIIIQHNFGITAEIETIKKICTKHNIFLLEDCAHSIGARIGEKRVGTIGDAAIFSFGRDKVISSVSGGIVVAKDREVMEKIHEMQSISINRSKIWILQNLIHAIVMPVFCRLIDLLKIGQGLIQLFQRIGLINTVYTSAEKQSTITNTYTHKMPNSMARLALQQLDELDSFNSHRRAITAIYTNFCKKNNLKYQKSDNIHNVFLRFTMFVENPRKIIAYLRKHGYLIGDWYNSVVMPMPGDVKKINYTKGSCPKAELYAQQSINLPTNHKITNKDAQRITKLLEQVL